MEDQASDDDDQADAEKSKKKRRKSQSKPTSLELLNEQWPATHAKQVGFHSHFRYKVNILAVQLYIDKDIMILVLVDVAMLPYFN